MSLEGGPGPDTTPHETPAAGQTVPARAGTWGAPTPIGYYAALRSSGTIAAPLRAGFSFTMTSVLLVQKPNPCRWPNATLALLVSAGMVLVFAVQTSLWLQSYPVTPSDYKDWYPDNIVGGYPDAIAFAWHKENSKKANTYSKATRRLYNIGILSLLAAITTAVVPRGVISASRLVVVVAAAAGLLAEVLWIVWTWIRSL